MCKTLCAVAEHIPIYSLNIKQMIYLNKDTKPKMLNIPHQVMYDVEWNSLRSAAS